MKYSLNELVSMRLGFIVEVAFNAMYCANYTSCSAAASASSGPCLTVVNTVPCVGLPLSILELGGPSLGHLKVPSPPARPCPRIHNRRHARVPEEPPGTVGKRQRLGEDPEAIASQYDAPCPPLPPPPGCKAASGQKSRHRGLVRHLLGCSGVFLSWQRRPGTGQSSDV